MINNINITYMLFIIMLAIIHIFCTCCTDTTYIIRKTWQFFIWCYTNSVKEKMSLAKFWAFLGVPFHYWHIPLYICMREWIPVCGHRPSAQVPKIGKRLILITRCWQVTRGRYKKEHVFVAKNITARFFVRARVENVS